MSKKISKITRSMFFNTFILALLLEMCNCFASVVDGLLTGRELGVESLAAFGIGIPYYTMVSFFGFMFAVGNKINVARALGKGDTNLARRYFNTAFFVTLVVGTILAIIGVAFSDKIAWLLGARGESSHLLDEASSFLKGLFIGTPTFLLYSVVSPISQIDGARVRPKIACIIVCVSDILVDFICIKWIDMGIFGMGLSSSISYALGFLTILPQFFGKNTAFSLFPKEIEFTRLKNICKAGFSSGLSMLFVTTISIVENLLIASVSPTVGLAALSVAHNVNSLLLTLNTALCSGVSVLVSLYIGEKDKVNLTDTLRLVLRYLAVIAVIGIATALCAPLIAKVYITNEPQTEEIAVKLLRFYSLALTFYTANMALLNYLQAQNKAKEALVLNICNVVVNVFLCKYLLTVGFGLEGLCISIVITDFLMIFGYFVVSQIRFRKTEMSPIQRMLNYPKSFPKQEDVFVETISTADQAVEFSRMIEQECLKRNVSKKNTYNVSLCIEEMLCNTIDHGFTKDDKQHVLEIKVVFTDEITLRIRDDCKQFDMKKKIENWQFNPDQPLKNIGIRMVLNSSKEVLYTYTLNTNNVIIIV